MAELHVQSEAIVNLKELVIDLPESVRDLDLNREGFENDAMKLPVEDFSSMIKRDDLKCRSEDHVLEMTLNYIEIAAEKTFNEARTALIPLIRLDLLSKDRLIELSTQKPAFIKGFEQQVIEALCAKLESSNTGSPSPFNTILSNGSRGSVRSNPRNYTDEKHAR